jgi:hypothetical protein
MQERDMASLKRSILLFSIVNALLILSPAFLNRQFPPYPLIKWGDFTDLLTPLVLIPLYWILFRLEGKPAPSFRAMLAFLVLAAMYAQGQGMHLAANSIGHLLENAKGTPAEQLTHFYDEVLSHYLWHLAIVGLILVLLARQWQNPFIGELSDLRFEVIAALIYGFTYFVTTIEAGTVPLGLPFAAAVTLFGLMRGRSELPMQPLLAFFFSALLLATLLFAIWGIYWRGFPQFSELGIIQ